MTLDKLIEIVTQANLEASDLQWEYREATDARDHVRQAHFRLTEALAHLKVAKQDW